MSKTPAGRDRFAGLDAVIRRARRHWPVPGLAVAVVADGRTVLCRCFGRRDLKRDAPVTPQTRFAIGSITKGFTATALGILADEGKLDWDRPVRDWLPDFRLVDAEAARRATPRDLLCHRVGLGRHDNAWYGLRLDRRELLSRLRHLASAWPFRQRWGYQNMMFMIAGWLVERIAGVPWARFVRERICGPLGMDGVRFSPVDVAGEPNVAAAHAIRNGRAFGAATDTASELGAAGSIWAGVADMAQWLRLNLAGGSIDGRRIVRAATLRMLHRPIIDVPEPVKWPELGRQRYALGWNVQSYRGRRTVWHAGLANGFLAECYLVPQANAGVVVLSNAMGHPVSKLVTYYLCDRLLGVRPAPWVTRMGRSWAQMRQANAEHRQAVRAEARAAAKDRPGSRPRPIRDFAGRYRNSGYGEIKIIRRGSRLMAEFAGIRHRLRRLGPESFEMNRPLWGAKDVLTFAADCTGRFVRVSIPFESTTAPIVFRRVGP